MRGLSFNIKANETVHRGLYDPRADMARRSAVRLLGMACLVMAVMAAVFAIVWFA